MKRRNAMSAEDFLKKLTSQTWTSRGDSTVDNTDYNPYGETDWRTDVILANEDYYPPENVQITVIPNDVPRLQYKVPQKNPKATVPATVLKTFSLKITGWNFSGKKDLESARYVIKGDHAVSSPIALSSTKSLVIYVRLRTLDSGKLVMVNELMWSVQRNPGNQNETFHDIQMWYCC